MCEPLLEKMDAGCSKMKSVLLCAVQTCFSAGPCVVGCAMRMAATRFNAAVPHDS